MRRGDAILADALGRLPESLSAKRGLSGAQIAVAGLLVVLAVALGVADIQLLAGVASLALWLFFTASLLLRSAAVVAREDDARPAMLSDDELPVYTLVVPVFREAAVVEDLVRALDAIDYPKGKLDIKLVAERQDNEFSQEFSGCGCRRATNSSSRLRARRPRNPARSTSLWRRREAS